MAKTSTKKKGTSKNAVGEKAAAKKTTARNTEAAAEPTETTPETKATKKETKERTRDPRLPAPGTVIQKLGRLGDVRCECLVEADGIRYKGTLYRTLSGAAKAAATDLNLTSVAQNGWLFWGLTKPARRGADPMEALERTWQRYCERAAGLLAEDFPEDQRRRLAGMLGDHAAGIAELARKLQTAKG